MQNLLIECVRFWRYRDKIFLFGDGPKFVVFDQKSTEIMKDMTLLGNCQKNAKFWLKSSILLQVVRGKYGNLFFEKIQISL